MTDGTAVLGVGTSSSEGVLTVYRVIVRRRDGEVEVEVLEPWQGTAADEARSMGDLVETLGNTLDRKRQSASKALAVKRTESTFRRLRNRMTKRSAPEG